MSEETKELYQERVPLYPRSVKGFYRNLKWTILFVAYSVYYLLPWLRWERSAGADQAVLFDIYARKFYIFDLVVYAQDIFWLIGFLVIAALLLFFVTGILGRVFCGYFCFQTLWTDVFIFIEKLVQGERGARMKLAKSDWNAVKVRKYVITWLLWFAVSFMTGLSFVLYWGDAPQLFTQFFTGSAPFPAYATCIFLTMATFVMAGIAREQVCTYMCPYARFQSVMFDNNTMVVAYDQQRGESGCGRSKPVAGLASYAERSEKGVGECIDCEFCVQVCPTGIDIRDGLQYQCISCALCIDACNTVMDAIKRPRGLIRYAALNAQDKENPTKIHFGYKNFAYLVTLVLAIGFLTYSIVGRSEVELFVTKSRQPLYVKLSDGRIQNKYSIKLNNKTEQPISLELSIDDLKRDYWTIHGEDNLVIEAGKNNTFTLFVRMYPREAHGHEQVYTLRLKKKENGKKTIITRKLVFSFPNEVAGR